MNKRSNMDTQPSVYVGDLINDVMNHTSKTYDEIENEMFKLYIYPAGENTYIDANDNHTNWLKIAISEVMNKQNISYLQITE